MAQTALSPHVNDTPTRPGALPGIAAAAIAVGVGALVAVPFGPAADARSAVGSAVIDLTPGPVKEWAIQTFGTNDKLFLTVMVLVVIAVVAAVAGQWERTRVPVGSVVIALAAVAGCAAVLSRPDASLVDVVPTLVGAVCGIAVLRFLTSRRVLRPRAAADAATETTVDQPADAGRRSSLAALGFVGIGVVGGVVGAALTRRLHSVSGDRAAFAPPTVARPLPPPPPDVQPAGVALPSYVTSAKDFYRIDTALSVPQLSRADWALKVHGMVDREITYRFGDLAKFAPVEKMVTLTCVSNPVGGNLISNGVWSGYRVRDLLAAAGVHPDADMVLSTSVDGFTAGTPVEALTDGRDALLAITLDGQPLPVEHGYPARLVVPGLYGYVSATKWVTDLELTRFDRAQAYWTGLGWSAKGPIKTESRIDVPRSGQVVPKGAVRFGGVAWAQPRGIRAVEVRIDDGPWLPAQLGGSFSNDAWRLWSFDWQAVQPGQHRITVRATDNTGAVQTADEADVMPDGATGYHTVSFSVA
ncbi:oxidoreductase [Mycolicibacterium madagascariense]|uniref:Oxidoreductase n=1 Tax=Mycolicibacterium madagascariense TaxID=212765 RepID=A0A7I7XG09_9MYCO|nr:molybdopterin-dependent oxidoreductase [Mycolicibacterium madagascariense]MCV7014742.1 molybdopterin-dependent oxidoreductase [Mycolicibacterium madagascariense]BBZ28134.1 oxidoreductase [Mycolicibacterium madagascariense]